MSEVFAVQHKTSRRSSRGGFNLVLAALLQRLTETSVLVVESFMRFFFNTFSF